MNHEATTKLAIGIVLGYVFARVVDVLTRKEVERVQVLPVPYVPQGDDVKPTKPVPKPSIPPTPAPTETKPVLLTANPVPVVAGRRYRVILAVGFPFSFAANEATVKKEAEDLGFRNVKAQRQRPEDFPGSRQGDYYIEGTWGGGGTTLARPTVPGISLVEVWEG